MNWLVRRARRLTAVAVIALAAAGVAYATIPDGGRVYTACMLNATGTIRLIDPSLPATNPMSRCAARETQIDWNQKGQTGEPGPQGLQGASGATGAAGKDGNDGLSVTSTALAPGDANCANGGSQFTSASGNTYACNGKDGVDGEDAAPGGTLSSIESLRGTPCTRGTAAGATAVAISTAGAIDLTCLLPDGFEPNDSAETAAPISLPAPFPPVFTIAPAADEDFFYVSVFGESVRVSGGVLMDDAGDQHAGAPRGVTCISTGGRRNVLIRVYGPVSTYSLSAGDRSC